MKSECSPALVMHQSRKPLSSALLGHLSTHLGKGQGSDTPVLHKRVDPALQRKPGALTAAPPDHPVLSLEMGEHFPFSTRDTNSTA